MGKRVAAGVEIATVGLFTALALRWAWTQNGWFEPYTVICGCMLICLELYRRFGMGIKAEQARPPEDRAASLIAWLLENVPSKELSETLPVALQLAHIMGDEDFEKWVRCELEGYSPGTMAEADMVPEYRIIPIRHLDIYKRTLIFEDADLAFLNQDRLRFGVRELEAYAKRGGMLFGQDQQMVNAIKEHMNIDVVQYVFNSASIFGILDAIRAKLLDRLHKVSQAAPSLR